MARGGDAQGAVVHGEKSIEIHNRVNLSSNM